MSFVFINFKFLTRKNYWWWLNIFTAAFHSIPGEILLQLGNKKKDILLIRKTDWGPSFITQNPQLRQIQPSETDATLQHNHFTDSLQTNCFQNFKFHQSGHRIAVAISWHSAIASPIDCYNHEIVVSFFIFFCLFIWWYYSVWQWCLHIQVPEECCL